MEKAASAAGEILPCPKIIRGQERLTPEQAAYARQFAQERIAAMLSTTPIDEREAEQHLRAAYHVAGLELVPMRWFDSPGTFILAHLPIEWASVWDRMKKIGQDIREDLVEEIGQDLVEEIMQEIGQDMEEDYDEDSVGYSVGLSVWSSAWDDGVGDRVWNSVKADVLADGEGKEVWETIRKDQEDIMDEVVEGSVRAYYGANWLSFYRFFHEVFEENELIHLALFNEMVSGYRLGSKEAWLVRKPILLQRDAQGRLHSADGMCIQYRDGWGFYAWHGTRCPEKLILHPEQLTKEEWMNERNLEVRRAMQEQLGNERFVKLVGGKCIEQGWRADLIEVDLGNDPERVARFVRVKDTSTERIYYLRVPPTFDQADEALAWTFGLEGQDYQPIQEA
ncbi:MAG TPA: hypothetical protein VH593_04340 [Ktedonobacteraceae bacterium]|jgi:hypothetical protein